MSLRWKEVCIIHGVTTSLLGADLPLLLEWDGMKGSEDFLMEIMWTCPIHAEPCVSMGEERFPVFHVSKCNSLRSNLVHSHQCQTGVRPLRPLSSAAGVGEQRVSLLG